MSIYGGPDIVTDGLVLHLDSASSKSYPGSGTTWFDLSGNNNHFTLFNNPIFNTSNKFFTFNGTSHYARSNNNFTINNTDLTICLWINNLTVGGGSCPCSTTRTIIDISAGYGDFIIMNTTGNSNTLQCSARSNSTTAVYPYFSFDANSLINKWIYLTFTYNNTTRFIQTYLNSSIANSNTISQIFNITSLINLGSYNRNCGNCYNNMSISHLYIYNKFFSTNEVVQNYNAIKGRFGL